MKPRSGQSKFALALSVGGTLTSTLLGGFLIGYFLDRRLGTNPWLMLTGIILGMIGAFWRIYRVMQELNDPS